jgi:hypothetical protein
MKLTFHEASEGRESTASKLREPLSSPTNNKFAVNLAQETRRVQLSIYYFASFGVCTEQ